MSEIPSNWLPMLTWPIFYYRQQLEYYLSESWQTWLIGGNGTGKSLLVYNTLALQMYGLHKYQIGEPPVNIKVLVPSFDYVKDVALEKLTSNQRVIFTELTDKQKRWWKYATSPVFYWRIKSLVTKSGLWSYPR